MLEVITNQILDTGFQIVLVTILVAGVARGFSGFGTGMIVAPIAAAYFSPQIAIAIIIIIDSVPTLPVVIPAWKKANWKEVLPIAIGYALLIPLGIWVLKFGDPTMLRWFIAAIIFTVVIILGSGWKYQGPRNKVISTSVGGLCGFLGGTCALPGPPAIVYWMASTMSASAIRANTLVFLFLSDILTGTGVLVGGMFTYEAIIKGLIASPIYLAGLLIGQSMFGYSSEKTYRIIAFTIILFAAISSLPIMDHLLRS